MSKYSGLEIAIIGMSGRFPGADSIKDFWNNIKLGKESISFHTDEEIIEEGEDPSALNNPNYVKANAYINNKEFFDSSFFNYRPDEARLMDPQIRLFHECVWEAIEDAGCNLNDSKFKIGLFAGSSTNLNWVINAELENKKNIVDSFTASMLSNARFLASRISYCLNLRGPSMMIDTACSTSLVAIHQACKSLLLGECNIAIAGGVTVTNSSKKGYIYYEGMVNSSDGHCRTFDAEANGTVGGEGAAIVVLKKLKNAIEDGDNIQAIVKGSGINNDGNGKVGFSAPSVDGQTEAIIMAQKWAKIKPESISLIEAHGTATDLGDPIEVEALNRAFGNSKEKYCALGSVKTNLGHLDSAAGATGLIKAVLAIKNRQIPPSLNFKSPNPKINFKDTPFYVNTVLKDWQNDQYPLRAGVSSFGIGGTNVHIILEEAPELKPSSESRDYQLLLVSAKTQTSLEQNIANLKSYLKDNLAANLADIAFTLQRGRAHFVYRKAVVCKNHSEAIELLSSIKFRKKLLPLKETSKPKVVFMFPGQGSQYTNMCHDLYEKELIFKKDVDNCFDIVSRFTNKNLRSIVFPSNHSEDVKEINETAYSQPLLFIIEYSLAQLLIKWGINPDIMIGHSFGEYVAACLCGVFSLEDALYLIVKRSELMQSVAKGKMLGISITKDKLQLFLSNHKDVSLSTANSTELQVVSGSDEAIEKFQTVISKEGYVCKIVPNSNGYHSYLMEEISGQFEKEVNSVKINKANTPFISNVTGKLAVDSEYLIPNYWIKHLCQTVLFSDGIETIMKNDQVIFIEVGPGVELNTFVRANNHRGKGHKVINLVKHQNTESNDLEHLLSGLGKLWISGVEPDWDIFYCEESRQKLSLPTYAFDKIAYPVHVNTREIISRLHPENTLVKNLDISKWFYAPSWLLSPYVSANKSAQIMGRTLIFADCCNISELLIDKYQEFNQEIICVRIGKSYQKKSAFLYEVNPSQGDGYEKLFSDLSSNDSLPDCIIHAWGITEQKEIEYSEDSCTTIFYSLFELVRSYQKIGNIQGKNIVLITNELHPIIAEGTISGLKSLSNAFLKVVSQEYQICTSHIDICLSENVNGDLIDPLFKEIQSNENGKVISLRNTQRWKQVFNRIEIPNNSQNFKQGGVYLITGGLGNFGFTIARHLLNEYKARVILLGRIKLPKTEEFSKYLGDKNVEKKIKEKINRLQILQNEQGEVFYLGCNLSKIEELSESVNIAEERYGSINGVIHAAGIVTGDSINPITELQKHNFKTQFEPKILGLQALKKVMGNRELDFCLLISSLSPILGGIGFGAYGPANTFMDYYINSYRRIGELKNWISLNIDGIDFEEKSTLAIFKEEIFEVLNRALTVMDLPQVIASTSDLGKRLERSLSQNATEEKEIQFQDSDLYELDGENSIMSDELLTTVEKTLILLWQSFFGKTNIDVDIHFFDVGGDSLKAITIIHRINKKFNINLSIIDLFKRPTIRLLGEYIDLIKSKEKQNEGHLSIPVSEAKEYYKLSSAQNRIFFLYEFDKTSLAYVLPKIIKLEGYLNKEKLHRVLNKIIANHEILRTYFEIINSNPVQRISDHVTLDIEYYHSSENKVDSAINKIIRPFDLSKAPLIRVGLIHSSPIEHHLVLVMHHIVTDGVSGNILLKDLMALYSDENITKPLLHYKDYSELQKCSSYKKELERQQNYWKEEFAELPEPTAIPIDFKRPQIKSYDGNTLDFDIGPTETDKLSFLAKQQGTSLFMIVLSVLKVFLAKLTNQEDILVGTVSSGRQHSDFENVFGMFVNTLVIRNKLTKENSFIEILNTIKKKVLKALDNQAYQFEDLLNDLKLDRDTSRNPLFDVMFSYENFASEEFKIPGLSISSYDYNTNISQFDLKLIAFESDDKIKFSFEYSKSLFKQETIEKFIKYFKRIISVILQEPYIKLADIELISDEDKYQLLHGFNNTSVGYHSEKTIIELFEEQASLIPHNIAVESEGRKYTYDWLNKISNQLANLLRDKGVKRESSVVVIMDRHIDLMVVLLGILKSGAKYIPIETYVPDNRIKDISSSVNAEIIITDHLSSLRISKVSENIVSLTNLLVAKINSDNSLSLNELVENKQLRINLSHYSNINLTKWNSSNDLAYVIFTSGSTGDPKGVAVQHKPVINLIEWVNKTYQVGENDKILFVSSISFDLSVYDIFGILSAGGTIRIATRAELEDPEKLTDIIINEGITFWDSAPAMLQQIIPFLQKKTGLSKSIGKLRLSFLSGDWIPLNMPDQMKSAFPKLRFIALGGATEATIWSNFYEVQSINENWNSIPYGKPIQNAKYLILDKNLKLCPIGVQGELYIGGECLAKEYINDKELSDKKFIRNPFSENEILYHTGDMARWYPDGNIEFLGRIDSQVKIRGYRIELGEIESKLMKYDGIDQVLAHVISKSRHDHTLCVYYVSAKTILDEDLKKYLKGELPNYMIPKYFIPLDELPITKNGKIDRASLPYPALESSRAKANRPLTETETSMVELWGSLLHLEKVKIGIYDDFFELGGHSIMAVHLINKIQDLFATNLKLRKIFELPSISELSNYIDKIKDNYVLKIPKAEKQDFYLVSPAQRRLFYEQLLNKNTTTYNIRVGFEIKGQLDPVKLEQAFQLLLNRHAGLRTSFLLVNEGVIQKINDYVKFNLSRIDDEQFKSVESALLNFIKPFDLSSESLIRGALYHNSRENRHFLFVDVHHIVCDGISLNILMNDFRGLYSGDELAPLEFEYVDYVHWQEKTTKHLQQQENFWLRKLSGEISKLELPVLQSRKQSGDNISASLSILEIDCNLHQKIREFTSESNVSDLMFFLSVLYTLLNKISGKSDIIIGIDSVGRTQKEFKDIIGTFTNLLPIRIGLDNEMNFQELLGKVKESVLESVDNQDFQFNQMISFLKKEKRLSGNLFDVHFSFSNYIDKEDKLHECNLVPIEEKGKLTTQYELKLDVTEEQNTFKVIFIYNTSLFENSTIELLKIYYYNLLTSVIQDKEAKISSIELQENLCEI